MKPFGWLSPPHIKPTELIVNICLWLAGGMVLGIGVAWLALHLPVIRAWFIPGPAILVMIAVLFISGLLLYCLFERFSTPLALFWLILMNLLTGLLFACIFSWAGIALALGVTGAMFAISAVIAHYAGSNISGGGYYLLMLLVGLSLTALVNIGLHNGPLEWIGCLVMVLLFGLTTAGNSSRIQLSARELYMKQFTTVQACAIHGALRVWLNIASLVFELLRLASYVIDGIRSR
ncbi:Bax inhibitor-1 family protein [Phytobacter diazotrophicus]|uniref:Bax inhibitor-1/YccA family protein n=1 Tax=Phytobacter diazotrophicus TaxID=395631 RepID=UPI0029355BB5|nr:Bax inhibitor-1 family protein [Phytobacter diazotrophicus]MDV2901058.1 Bax inhibitor-1 family protein [Phytobacter diazotrophicus]